MEPEVAAGISDAASSQFSHHRLTIENLRDLIPTVHAGLEAESRLADVGPLSGDSSVADSAASLSLEERDELARLARRGRLAQEELLQMGMPLLRSLATREYRRRHQWDSNLDLDDLLQDACIGFLRGLAVFDPSKTTASASHYLGQWAVSMMRRAADRADSDIYVPPDVMQKWRMIRSIRARLKGELGREPSDQEIIDAGCDEAPRSGPKLGRAKTKTASKSSITERDIAEERRYAQVSSTARRFTFRSDADDSQQGYGPDDEQISLSMSLSERSQEPHNSPTVLNSMLGEFLRSAMESAGMGYVQMEIVSRFHGIPPFEPSPSLSSVAQVCSIGRATCQQVVDAYTAYMATPGSTLHQITLTLGQDSLEAAGLSWARDALGAHLPEILPEVPEVLQKKLKPKKVVLTPPDIEGSWAAYQCEVHGEPFLVRFTPDTDPAYSWPCPQCRTASGLVDARVNRSGDTSPTGGRNSVSVRDVE